MSLYKLGGEYEFKNDSTKTVEEFLEEDRLEINAIFKKFGLDFKKIFPEHPFSNANIFLQKTNIIGAGDWSNSFKNELENIPEYNLVSNISSPSSARFNTGRMELDKNVFEFIKQKDFKILRNFSHLMSWSNHDYSCHHSFLSHNNIYNWKNPEDMALRRHAFAMKMATNQSQSLKEYFLFLFTNSLDRIEKISELKTFQKKYLYQKFCNRFFLLLSPEDEGLSELFNLYPFLKEHISETHKETHASKIKTKDNELIDVADFFNDFFGRPFFETNAINTKIENIVSFDA